MIEPNTRKAIYCLHQEGMGVREIARSLKIAPNTVISIIEQKGEMPEAVRKDKIRIDPDLLVRLYSKCQGRAQRVAPILPPIQQEPTGRCPGSRRGRRDRAGSNRKMDG